MTPSIKTPAVTYFQSATRSASARSSARTGGRRRRKSALRCGPRRRSGGLNGAVSRPQHAACFGVAAGRHSCCRLRQPPGLRYQSPMIPPPATVSRHRNACRADQARSTAEPFWTTLPRCRSRDTDDRRSKHSQALRKKPRRRSVEDISSVVPGLKDHGVAVPKLSNGGMARPSTSTIRTASGCKLN